jgi:hypothetical protein
MFGVIISLPAELAFLSRDDALCAASSKKKLNTVLY